MAVKSKLGAGAKAGIGTGLAALAAAAAGAYYFYGGKHSARHRRQLKSWVVKAKGEMMEKMENLKTLSGDSYQKSVKDVMAKYKKLKHIDPDELAALTTELKNSWKRISAHINTSTMGKSNARPAGRAKKKR